MEDIAAANRCLPDFAGFVFAASRRRVDMDTAKRLKEGLDSRIQAVGVFVNQEISLITRLYREGIIDLAQLHGDESGEYILRLRENCGCPVIKAVGVDKALPALPEGPDYLMFDAVSASRGGTGLTFDWRTLEGYAGKQYFLAGGIDISNVIRAVGLLHPYCVDVSSGVETGGLKDPDKMERFTKTVKEIG
jgi:phosphoribosylanthranilate isomerase